MRKKWLIMILLALALLIMLVLRLTGSHDKSDPADADTQDQTAQTDENNTADSSADDAAKEQLGSLTANENGGVDITVTAEDGSIKTYTFTDVTSDAWYAQAVDYVVSTGVMSGDEDQNLFRPEYGVERSQFAVIVRSEERR